MVINKCYGDRDERIYYWSNFYYEKICLGKKRQTDILSKSLQSSGLSAAEGQDLATIVIKKLEGNRKKEQFEMFWEDIMKKKKHLDIGDPILPRQC